MRGYRLLAAAGIFAPIRFEQEPEASLGLVQPDLDQACAGDVAVLIADVVSLAQLRRESLVVVAELGEHVGRLDIIGVVVGETLGARDMTDRSDGETAELANPLRERVRHGEELASLFIEQQMVIPKVRAAHVPMEVLGLEVEREGIGKHAVERRGNISGRRCFQVGRSRKCAVTPAHELLGLLRS